MKFLNYLLVTIALFVTFGSIWAADPGPTMNLRWYVVLSNGRHVMKVETYYLAGLTVGQLKLDLVSKYFERYPDEEFRKRREERGDNPFVIDSSDVAGIILKELGTDKPLYVSLKKNNEMIRPIIEENFDVKVEYNLSALLILEATIESGLYNIPSVDGMEIDGSSFDKNEIIKFQSEFYENYDNKKREALARKRKEAHQREMELLTEREAAHRRAFEEDQAKLRAEAAAIMEKIIANTK